MKNPVTEHEIAATISDPKAFFALCWPGLKLYDKQLEILLSVRDNPETFVHAAHKTGKTLIAAAVAIWFLATRSPAKVVIMSSNEEQLRRVLWAEICRLIKSSAVPLPFEIQDLVIRKLQGTGRKKTYGDDVLIAVATNKVESFQGHHLKSDKPRVLAILDEASGIADEMYEAAQSWAHRMLVIGNPLTLGNFFYARCKQGNTPDPAGLSPLLRKVIHISGRHVPNVLQGLMRREEGLAGYVLPMIDGLLTYPDFVRHTADWDEQDRMIRLEGNFYEGEGVLLFPPAVLDRACDRGRYAELSATSRTARAMGIDVAADGPDWTVFTIVDENGIIEQIKQRTPNTMEICGITIELMRKYNLGAQAVIMDAGGGGKQLADRLKEQGHIVTTINFGESPADKQAYPNRRVEMYAILRDRLDERPDVPVFNLGMDCEELRQELAAFLKQLDSSGRLILPTKRPGKASAGLPSLLKLLGRSPDRADSLALAVYKLMELLPLLGPPRQVAFYDSGEMSKKKWESLSRTDRILYENGHLDWGDDDDGEVVRDYR